MRSGRGAGGNVEFARDRAEAAHVIRVLVRDQHGRELRGIETQSFRRLRYASTGDAGVNEYGGRPARYPDRVSGTPAGEHRDLHGPPPVTFDEDPDGDGV